MKNRQSGFSLFELIVVMAIFTIVIVGASEMFISILSDFKQQSKITVTNIEGILGLEVMRRDIQNTGYGLPWSWGAAMNYEELQTAPDTWADANSKFNDAPSNLPRALVSGNGTGWHGTDRLVIKAVNVAMNSTVDRWNFLYTSPAVTTNVWTPATENLQKSDYVIAISQSATSRTLVLHTGGGFSKTFEYVTGFNEFSTSAEKRSDPSIVYGLDPNTDPKMPFNRADYYVQEPASASDLPRHCASGTGILYKRVINQQKGSSGFLAPLSILDCVADMQVAYFNVDSSGNLQKNEDIHTLTADDVRNFVREIRVYILAQEGQRDNNFTYPTNPVLVGETGTVFGTVGRSFDFLDGANSIPDWKNYRWKLYTIVVRPSNLQ
jgi:prepilin-type N-terminal cleavage/methylation domain-containing protein